AECCRQAGMLQQWHRCEILVLDASLADDIPALPSAAGSDPLPLLYLTDASLPDARHTIWHGPQLRVPRQVVVEHPDVLASSLDHLIELSQLRLDRQAAETSLRECRCQVDRLAELVWQSVAHPTPGCWLNQQHVLKRCMEEVARSRRH